MTPKTDRGEETKRRILRIAADAFASRGYAATSLQDIVGASEMTKGAFYFHFDSKEALALEVFRSKHEEWGEAVLESIADEGRALDKIVQVMRTVARLIDADPSSRCVGRIADELSHDPALAETVNQQFDAWVELSTGLVRAAQEEGDVRDDVDPKEISEIAVAGFIGLETVSGNRGDVDIGEWTERYIQVLLRAMIAPVAEGAETR